MVFLYHMDPALIDFIVIVNLFAHYSCFFSS